jgi:uncharacterized membrane protein YozB (DUF420 family)
MLTAANVILLLKIAVAAVTLLLLASLAALARGNYRLHGRINLVFFALTLAALLGLEVVTRMLEPEMFGAYLRETNAETALSIHLCFAVPAAVLMPFMLYTGLTHRRTAHIVLAIVFSFLWTGTFVTGIFFLPHTAR